MYNAPHKNAFDLLSYLQQAQSVQFDMARHAFELWLTFVTGAGTRR
jgi:hypothetical protein